MYVCPQWTCRGQERRQIPDTGVAYSCELPQGSWKLSLGLLQPLSLPLPLTEKSWHLMKIPHGVRNSEGFHFTPRGNRSHPSYHSYLAGAKISFQDQPGEKHMP